MIPKTLTRREINKLPVADMVKLSCFHARISEVTNKKEAAHYLVVYVPFTLSGEVHKTRLARYSVGNKTKE